MVYFYFYFFADWLVDIPDASSTNRVRQTMIHVEDKIYSGSDTNRCSAFFLQQNFELEPGFKR